MKHTVPRRYRLFALVMEVSSIVIVNLCDAKFKYEKEKRKLVV